MRSNIYKLQSFMTVEVLIITSVSLLQNQVTGTPLAVVTYMSVLHIQALVDELVQRYLVPQLGPEPTGYNMD
jgi:hypothetical protein